MTFGPSAGCQAGHASHETVLARVVLDGPTKVPDYPAFPSRLRQAFELYIYKWARYDGFQGFCPGQDEVSRSIGLNGVWEGFETLLYLDALSKAYPGDIYDFGAHVGWYTVLGLLTGRHVHAWEADLTHFGTLARNVSQNGLSKLFHSYGSLLPRQRHPGALGPVAFLKIDLEGMEAEACAYMDPFFQGGWIQYGLIEASPCFDGTNYPELIKRLGSYGYRFGLVPDKGLSQPAMAFFEASPVNYVQSLALDAEQIEELLGRVSQANLFFWRG